MQPLEDLSDSRLLTYCVYCGGSSETRDHVPSRVFLDEPFPDNPPKVGACTVCNQGFSKHEEYLACFLEAVRVGSAALTDQMRPKIEAALAHSPKLAARIAASSQCSLFDEQVWIPELERVEKVVLKLARGHAAYELSEPLLDEPDWIAVLPLLYLNAEELVTSPEVCKLADWA